MTRAALTTLLAVPTLLSASSGVPVHAQVSAGQTAPSSGLILSAAQKAKASARQARFKKDIAAISANPKLSNAEKQAKANALFQAMNQDMLAILTPEQRTKVLKQRQITAQYQADMRALQANKTLTESQKEARSIQITQNARAASVALLPPAERAAATKRYAVLEQAQTLSLQLTNSETPAQSQQLKTIADAARNSMQTVISDKTLSDPAKTAKIVAIRKDALARDMALLTPAQRALYGRIQALVSPPPAH